MLKIKGFFERAAYIQWWTMNGGMHNEWEITFEEFHRKWAIAFVFTTITVSLADYTYIQKWAWGINGQLARFWQQRATFQAKQQYVFLA